MAARDDDLLEDRVCRANGLLGARRAALLCCSYLRIEPKVAIATDVARGGALGAAEPGETIAAFSRSPYGCIGPTTAMIALCLPSLRLVPSWWTLLARWIELVVAAARGVRVV